MKNSKFIKCFNKTPWLAWMINGRFWLAVWDGSCHLGKASVKLLAIVLVGLVISVILHFLGVWFLMLTIILIAICIAIDWSHFDSCSEDSNNEKE